MRARQRNAGRRQVRLDGPRLQALIMGIVQGLTEFLPVSSSGHLIIVPCLFGWDDAFITSLAFSVMLHLGTLIALLIYFRADWLRLIPAGLATIRDRSFRGDPDRQLAWLLVAATIPAAIVGVAVQRRLRDPGPSDRARRGHARRRRHHPVGRRPRRRPDQGRRGRDLPDRDRHRRRPGAGPHPGHQPVRDLDLGRAGSPVWTARPPPASRS